MTSDILNIGRIARAALVVAAMAGLSGCISPYIDTSLPELKPEDKVSISSKHPVQLLFEFQTKGVDNGAATDLLKTTVWDTAEASGLFSQVGSAAAPDGALLHITINNTPLDDDAFAKGFVTGFTFGLIGSTAGDGYICTLEYLPGGGTAKLTQTLRDAIYTNIGAKGAPPHAEKMPDLTTAAKTMARRVVANGLNELAKMPDFPK